MNGWISEPELHPTTVIPEVLPFSKEVVSNIHIIHLMVMVLFTVEEGLYVSPKTLRNMSYFSPIWTDLNAHS